MDVTTLNKLDKVLEIIHKASNNEFPEIHSTDIISQSLPEFNFHWNELRLIKNKLIKDGYIEENSQNEFIITLEGKVFSIQGV